jgi:hypothetical protein
VLVSQQQQQQQQRRRQEVLKEKQQQQQQQRWQWKHRRLQVTESPQVSTMALAALL